MAKKRQKEQKTAELTINTDQNDTKDSINALGIEPEAIERPVRRAIPDKVRNPRTGRLIHTNLHAKPQSLLPRQYKGKIGAPSMYTNDLGTQLISDISNKDISIEDICLSSGIHKETFYSWINNDRVKLEYFGLFDTLHNHFLRAMEKRQVSVLERKEKDMEDQIESCKKADSWEEIKKLDVVMRGIKIQLDQARWRASKHNRALFGDRMDINQTVTIQLSDSAMRAWEESKLIKESKDISDMAEYDTIQDIDNEQDTST